MQIIIVIYGLFIPTVAFLFNCISGIANNNSIAAEVAAIPFAAAQPSISPDVSGDGLTENASRDGTFLAEGTINQLTPISPSEGTLETGDQGGETLFLLGGDWRLSVNNGNVDDFIVNIVMIAENGTMLHYHDIQELTNVTTAASPISSEQTGGGNDRDIPRDISLSRGINGTTTFSGFADITTNGVTEWENIGITITINNANAISIIPNPGEVDHFYGLPIYGIVTSIVDEAGRPIYHTDNATVFHGRGSVALYDDAAMVAANESAEEDDDNGDDFNLQDEPQETLRIPYPDTQADSPFLDSTITNRPVVARLSDDGNYLVQLRWAQSTILPLPGINYQLFFLDPEQPHATEAIVPPWESNFTGYSRLNASVTIQPEILLNFELVDSYDMTVYSDTGSILWQKDNLQVYGGRGQGLITFEERYRGPITIEITDIQPMDAASAVNTPDSVTFNSLVVR